LSLVKIGEIRGVFWRGGRSHKSKISMVFSPSFCESTPPCDGYFVGGGWVTYARRGEFDAPKGSLNTPARHLSIGGALRVTASSSHPSTRHRYASREVVLGPVEEPYDRGLERLDILTLVFLQEPHANECVD
jgi:hypothetical protein